MPGPNVFAGADGINEKGQPVEYKSTTNKNCKGAYTGVSVQKTWEEQEKYLITEKIGKYPEHYYNRFEDGKLVESWKLSGKEVLRILLPKFEKRYNCTLKKIKESMDKGERAAISDPRLRADVTWRDIQKYGKKVI